MRVGGKRHHAACRRQAEDPGPLMRVLPVLGEHRQDRRPLRRQVALPGVL